LSIPVLALEAQTSYWTSVAAALPGHESYAGARGTGGHWWLPADRPAASLSRPAPNVRKGTGWAKARSAVPTWIAIVCTFHFHALRLHTLIAQGKFPG